MAPYSPRTTKYRVRREAVNSSNEKIGPSKIAPFPADGLLLPVVSSLHQYTSEERQAI